MPLADEFKSTVHLLGIVALFLCLLGMMMKNILTLRIFSMAGNFFYIIYGLSIGAPPLIIGGAVVVVIHGFHIHKLIQTKGEKPGN